MCAADDDVKKVSNLEIFSWVISTLLLQFPYRPTTLDGGVSTGYLQVTGTKMRLTGSDTVPADRALFHRSFAQCGTLVAVENASLAGRLLHGRCSSLYSVLISIITK